MPRPQKGARLYEREREGRPAQWVILDTGGIEITTGTQDRRAAEARLADYISGRDRKRGPSEPAEMTIGTALSIYGEEHAMTCADPARIGYAIQALDDFWRDLKVSAAKSETCRRYAKSRTRTLKSGEVRQISPATVRRELGVLQAAFNYCAKEGYLTSAPQLTLPESAEPKDRWLTREEMAWMLRAARRLRVDGRHLIKFILIGRYTGTRKAAALSLALDVPGLTNGWIDTENGILYRAGASQRRTKKRQPTARLPRPFLSFVRRWREAGARWAVEDHTGARIGDIKNAWKGCCRKAEQLAAKAERPINLTGVTPHVLRHTAITWAMQAGAQKWDVCGFFGVTMETLERVYAHHHPDHQGSAVRAMEGKRK